MTAIRPHLLAAASMASSPLPAAQAPAQRGRELLWGCHGKEPDSKNPARPCSGTLHTVRDGARRRDKWLGEGDRSHQGVGRTGGIHLHLAV